MGCNRGLDHLTAQLINGADVARKVEGSRVSNYPYRIEGEFLAFIDDVVQDLIDWSPKLAPCNEPGHESSEDRSTVHSVLLHPPCKVSN